MNYNSDEGLLLYSSTVVLLISFKLEVWLPVSSLLISSWMELRDKHHDMSCYTFIRRWQQKPTALTGNDKPQWTQSIHKSNHCTKDWRDEDSYLFHSGLKKKCLSVCSSHVFGDRQSNHLPVYLSIWVIICLSVFVWSTVCFIFCTSRLGKSAASSLPQCHFPCQACWCFKFNSFVSQTPSISVDKTLQHIQVHLGYMRAQESV